MDFIGSISSDEFSSDQFSSDQFSSDQFSSDQFSSDQFHRMNFINNPSDRIIGSWLILLS